MLDHLSFPATDLRRSAEFYDAALAPLGYARAWTVKDAVGYGPQGGGDKFALKESSQASADRSPKLHVAFTAPNPAAVDAFHAAAVATGGRDCGPPGLRPQYGPDYYAAFAIDPDGFRVEAVFHGPLEPR